MSIAYASRPRLGPTNPTRTGLPSETLRFRRYMGSHMFSLLMPTFSLLYPNPFQSTLFLLQNAPYHSPCVPIRSFGVVLEPVTFSAQALRPVSCYALFKGWLLLSQPPGCLTTSHRFPLSTNLRTLAVGLGCFLSTMKLISHSPTAVLNSTGIRSLVGFGKR